MIFSVGELVEARTPDELHKKFPDQLGFRTRGQIFDYAANGQEYSVDFRDDSDGSIGRYPVRPQDIVSLQYETPEHLRMRATIAGGSDVGVGDRVQFVDSDKNRATDFVAKAGVISEINETEIIVTLDELRKGRTQKVSAGFSEIESEAVAAAALSSEGSYSGPISPGVLAAIESGGLIYTPEGVDPHTGLTGPEKAVMDALVDFWGKYTALPEQHPNEIQEVFSHVNALQNLLAVRVARAVFPQMWPTIDVEGERRREAEREMKRRLSKGKNLTRPVNDGPNTRSRPSQGE